MNYLLSASLVLLLAWPACHFLLRYSNRYTLNRWLLLFAFGVIALLPLVPVTSPAPAATQAVNGTIEYVITDYVAPTTPITTTATETAAAPTTDQISSVSRQDSAASLSLTWPTVYLIGLALFATMLLFRLAFLFSLHLRSRPNGDSSYRLLHPNAQSGQAFTFGRNIYFSIDVPDGPDFDHILTHERIHARQGHSTDILLSEVFLCIFWFHPIAWWLRNKLRANLEYLVDAEVLSGGTNRRDYQLALVRQSHTAQNLALSLPFSEPTLKDRISRMTGLPQHKIVALLATVALLFWVGVAGVVVFGETRPADNGMEPFEAYYADRVPEQIITFNIYAKRAPTVDEYYQLRAILKHIPESNLYLYKNTHDEGMTMSLRHWQNKPVTLYRLPTEVVDDRMYRLALMPRIAPFKNINAPLPTGGYFVPVAEDNDQHNIINPVPGSTFITQSYGYEPSRLDLENFEFGPGEEFVVTINGQRFPLRPAEIVPATGEDKNYFLFDNGSVAPTEWEEGDYFVPFQQTASVRFSKMLGCQSLSNCPRSMVGLYGPSIDQAKAFVEKYKPLPDIEVRAVYNDQPTTLEQLLSRSYGPNSILQVGYRTDDNLMDYGYLVHVIDDSPAQIERTVRELTPPERR